MYQCRVCGKAYLSQEEADLCTPADQVPQRYPSRARITPETSAFNDQAS